MMSERRLKFQRLIVQANAQPTDWLIANVRDYHPERDVSRLSMLACLRVICSRTYTGGLPYRDRMKVVKAKVFS